MKTAILLIMTILALVLTVITVILAIVKFDVQYTLISIVFLILCNILCTNLNHFLNAKEF